MIDIGTLDTIIALVVVLLVLSLIVQSIQSLIKKLFKLKSSVVEDSLTDLFRFIDSKKLVNKSAEEIVSEVTEEFKKLGRVSLIKKRLMLDSVAKDDLKNILDKINSGELKGEVEKWFDTVMQSFDERYTRHMKTIALCIAFLVVVGLNADFFSVYRNIAASDVMRAAILQKGEALQKGLEEKSKASPTPQPSPGETANKSNNELTQDLKQFQSDMQQYLGDYKGLGFTPLRPQQLSEFFNATGAWQGIAPGQRFVHALKVLLGWAIMTLLLSAGAPFWEDTLSSLFGIKNLIQKKTKNGNGKKPGSQQGGGQDGDT